MNQILYSKKNNNKRTKVLVLVFCIISILLIVFSVSFGIANKTNTDKYMFYKNIPYGIWINNFTDEILNNIYNKKPKKRKIDYPKDNSSDDGSYKKNLQRNLRELVG